MIQACTTPCQILAAENNTFLGELQPKREIDCLVKTLWKDFFASGLELRCECAASHSQPKAH